MLRSKGLSEKVLLLGIDGLDPKFSRKMVDEGHMPNLKKLIEAGSYAIITTHDSELCQIEGASNYYFLEHYVDDKIAFDYTIREGVSNTRNAIYLLKMAGIMD